MSINTTHHLPAAPSPLMQRHVLQRVEESLARRFDGVAAETVRATVREVAAEFKRSARMTMFLPALTEREAARRLQAVTPAHEPMAAAA
ncbi:three-helix bundle dimerization domain-containing protein [Micrococcus endophyticus]|uniref:three-helix bundle dimerization domain-containing protein n=1 Tax=Micrococcus endophyticus TaxID=455343 RepID=UPI0034CE0064